MDKLILEIEKKKIGKIEKNVEISKLTTYKAGGIAKLVVFPKNVDKLIQLLKILKNNNVKFKVIGNGSNLIFSDNIYDGVLIKLSELNNIKLSKTIIKAEAGCNLIPLALKVSKLGLTGLEFATGIPGTVGGAIYMNAGAYKSDMGYIVSDVTVLDKDYNIVKLYNKDLKFKYRTSILQKNKDLICLSATFVLKPGNKMVIKELIDERRQKRLLTQPLEYPSAGSVFRNPDEDFSWRLIDSCGLKGYKIGGAEVSKKHANFIINKGNASGKDIHDLIIYVHDTVLKETGVDLKIEQEFVNWE